MLNKLKLSDVSKKTMAVVLALTTALGPSALPAFAGTAPATPIQHLVVIFQENVSFDHYFGTYPNATNPSGEPKFKASPNTPTVNGLSGPLSTKNPNLKSCQWCRRLQSISPRSHTSCDARPEPRLYGRTAGI